MKTKISRFGRSTVSVILAVMMLLSTMLIGTVSTVNATVNDAIKVYFDKSSCIDNGNNSTDGWSNINAYAFDSNNTSVRTYTNSADATGSVDWPGKTMNKEGNDIYSILVEPTATQIIFNNGSKQTGDISLPQDDQLNWKNTPVIYRNNKWTSYSASVDTTGVVTDTRLISVLDGSKVMFYGGEANSWGQTYFVAMNTQNTGDVADRAKTDYKKQLTAKGASIDFKFGILCVPAGTYYMGHSGWAPNLSANVVAGDAFVIYNSEINDFTKVAEDGSNLLLQSVSTGTKTATTTLSATEVATGDLLGVTTSTSAGNSSLGFDNTFEYYVHNRTTDKFYKVALSEGKLDTSAFTDDGEYEVKTVLKDANGLYVLADSDNFVISNKAKYSVTFGSNDANMGKVTVSDGTNSYTTSPAFVEKGKSVTFTANPSEGYAVEGWYRDADCKNAITGAGTNTSYEVTVNANTNVYVKFKSTTIDPEYRLTGDLSAIGGWNGYDNALKFDTPESDGSYSKVITVTDDDVNNKFFKLIKSENGSDKYYGPDNSTYNIILSNSSVTAYDTFEGSGSGKDFYFSKAGTYKIHYIVKTGKNTPSVWVEENTTKYNVTVAESIKSSASVDKTEFAKGETVTVKATPETGKVLDSVTVKAADGTTVETTVSGNTATFTMPDHDVTVTNVTFRDANKYTVNFSSINDEFGTVSAEYKGAKFTSGTEVTEGDEVTFTAKPNSGYALSDWTVNGTSVSSTTNPYKITVNSNTTVVANFKVEDSGEPSGYYILWGTDASFSNYEAKVLYLKDDGKYYANFDAKTDKIGQNENYYFVFSTSNTTSGVKSEQTNVTINEVTQNKFYFQSNNSDISGVGSTRVPKIWNESADLLGFKIIVSDIVLNDKKVTYSCEPTFDVAPADTVEITAKDGTIRAGYTDNKDGKKTTAVLGDTELSITTPDKKIIDASPSYPIDGKNRAVTAKKVPNGSTVTVTTTIDPTATFAGHSGSDYYVKGFSVNGIFGGVLSQTDGKTHEGDVYTYEFKVNQEIYGSKLEITPVYFLKNDDNCVYFYIENYDSAKQIWGNTPSCYVYYGSGKTTLEALGYYPGQPMVDYNGSIFTQIPKSIVNGDTTEKITGMTLNNYVWDDVHKDYNGKNQIEDNAQTYDYDDFVKIAESGAAADNIIYRFKYNTHDNVPGATLTTSDTDPDGWEVFLDYQNYPTDIFGNIISNKKLDYKDTQSVTSQGNYLSIISDGYQNNYIGKYATAWSIYNMAGNKVATIPSSALLYALGKSDEQIKKAINLGTTPPDFLPGKDKRNEYWTTFKTLYNDYKGVYAQINFEAAIKGGDEKGNRLDGRWYYSQNQQDITGEIKIQYANTLDDYKVGSFQEDTFADDKATSIVGKTTGASAYFTNPEDQVRKLVTKADNTQDYKFEVNATSTAAYTFVGWYRLIDGDYKAINPSNMSSLTGAVTQNSDVTLVARYIKTPGGSMTFQHSLYNGTNAGGGKATTEIQVVVKDREDKSLYDSGKIAGTASIDKTKITELARQEGLTVTVTLYTTTKNLYNFKGYYSAENTTDITAFNPTTGFTTNVSGDRTDGLVTTSEYTFSFNEYYNEHRDTLIGDNAGTVYYNFYSDITSIKVPYKVQFSYTDRKGDQKYYNKAGYVDPENTSSYTIVEKNTETNGEGSKAVEVTLTDSFILTLAPYESNFTKNLIWNKTPVSNTAFDSSDSKSIASAVVNSTQSDRTIHLNIYKDSEGKPTPLINNDGVFKLYEKDGNSELPYGSVFYTDNGDGTYTYDITAEKTYTDEDGTHQFMYWAIYSDSKCEEKDLVIKAYNSEGHFSYVAYDNCWIVPVYGESSTPSASVKEVYTSTQFMEVTRNQWTAENADSFTTGFDVDTLTTLNDFNKEKGEDKLYADFVLNFFYNGKQLSVFDPNSLKVQAGVLIQRLKPDENETGTGYITDLDYYANKKFTPKELADAEKDAIDKITTGTSTITSVKQQINNSRLDNKNRLQYYTRFNNVKDNSDYVFRLYTYIQYTDANGKQVVELSDPVYFTFYDIANK